MSDPAALNAAAPNAAALNAAAPSPAASRPRTDQQSPGAVPPGPLPPGALRIGNAERDQAATALAEHFSAGRLDAVEFDTRSRAAYAARTVDELDPLFADLPAPHPEVPLSAAETASLQAWQAGRDARQSYRARRSSAGGRPSPRAVLVLLFVLACVVWAVATGVPPFFVFPAIWLLVFWRGGSRHYRYR